MDWTFSIVAVFAIFIPALILPGPDFVAVVRSSVSGGKKSGLLTSAGVSLGLAFYATLSLLGLSAILIQYQWLAWAVRVLGGCYLVYLGIKLILTRAEMDSQIAEESSRISNPFLFGILVSLTNPKAIVLFTSVFATSVTDVMPIGVMMTMVGLVFASTLVWYALVSLFLSSSAVSRRLQTAFHWVERVAGLCFVGIGGRILSDSRNPVNS
ncbi:MAG: LysE family translocator [Hyphomicrobiales bacterium]